MMNRQKKLGHILDQYRLKEYLGSGSLGETYLAVSLLDQKEVIIKLIDPELAAKPGLTDKIAELSQLNAPFVRPFTLEAAAEQHYLVMADVYEDNLQTYLTKLKLSHTEQVKIAVETAVSLIIHIITRLHQNDFTQLSIHGGLHPRNMLLNQQIGTTEIILADFCQAELVRQATVQDEKERLVQADAAEMPRLRGLAPYTPTALWPQNGELQKADARTDLFALGHLLYFLLHNKHLPQTMFALVDGKIIPDDADADEIDTEFQNCIRKITQLERDKKEVDPRDYATLAALTAVSVSHPSPSEQVNSYLWRWWHHILVQIRRGEFRLLPTSETERQAQFQQLLEPMAILSPNAPEAQFSLRGISPLTNAGSPEDEAVERPSENETFIEISRPGAVNGHAQPIRFFTVRPEQGLISIGSAANNDISLGQDGKILPHHLEMRQMAQAWHLYIRGSGVWLNGAELTPGQPEVWPPGTRLTVGSYQLRLHQPTATDEQLKIIGLDLLPSQLEIEPGIQKKVGITVRNNGQERGYFKVEVKDLGTQDKPHPDAPSSPAKGDKKNWFYLPQDGIVLNPREQQELPLRVHPPPGEPSQTRIFAITARRIDKAFPPQQQKLWVHLLGTTTFATRLQPSDSQTSGTFRLLIRNDGNVPQRYDVYFSDPQETLKFAVVDTAVEEATYADESTANPTANGANGRSVNRRFSLPNNPLTRLFARTEPGRQAQTALSAVQRQQRQVQWAYRTAGTLLPKSQMRFPQMPRRQLKFAETRQVEESVPPNQQAILFFRVEPRQRPFRWQPEKAFPFECTITPKIGAKEGEARKETAVLQVRSRLSRSLSVLLLGLLLIIALLVGGLAAFRANKTVNEFRAAQATGVAYGRADLDGDALPSQAEVADLEPGTDPNNPDSDGDGLPDGVENELAHLGICPTKMDCDGDGLPDPEEIRFSTPTPTPPGGLPFPTSQAPPPATRIPTVTPLATAVPNIPTQIATVPYTGSDRSLEIGDTGDNMQQIESLTFDTTAQLPANAIIQEIHLLLVMDNAEEYGRLQQELGNVYVTVGSQISEQQLADLAVGNQDDVANLYEMRPAPNANNILIAKLENIRLDGNGLITTRLFFELGSDQDGIPDTLTIWSNFQQPSSQEHPPMLHITYSLPASGNP